MSDVHAILAKSIKSAGCVYPLNMIDPKFAGSDNDSDYSHGEKAVTPTN